MAYDASTDQNDDEDAKNQANTSAQGQGGDASQASTTLSGGSSGLAGQSGQAASGQSAQAQGPSSSGSWTNLNSYLDANKDQAGGLGDAVSGAVSSKAQTAQNDLGSVTQGFQNQDPFKAINSTSSSDVDQSLADPSQYAAAGSDTSTPLKYLNNNWGLTSQNQDISQYGGDGSTPSWASVGNEYNTAASALQNTQTEAGRQSLLQDQYGQAAGGYNQGQQKFDQLLLQQDPGNQAKLNSVYGQYSPGITPDSTTGLSGDLASALTNGQSYAQGAASKAAGYQTQALGDLNNDISGLNANVSKERATDSANFNNAYQTFANDLTNRSLTQSEAQELGLSNGQQTFNENLLTDSGLKAGNNVYAGSQGANYAASDPDWTNYSGLNALVGGVKSNDAQIAALKSIGLTGTKADQALAPAPVAYTVDKGNLNQYLNNAQTGYQNDFNSAALNAGHGAAPTTYADIQKYLSAGAPKVNATYDPFHLLANEGVTPAQMQALLDQFNQAQGTANQLTVRGPDQANIVGAGPGGMFPGINGAVR